MEVTKKIYLNIFIWLVVTGAMYMLFIPRFETHIIKIKSGYEGQLAELDKLKSQAKSLQRMQEDLDNVKKQEVQPEDFFTKDVKLVREVEHIEAIAELSGVEMSLALSGQASKAQPAPGSASGLVVIPYNIGLEGFFPDVITFMKYLENSYFVSPINGVNISLATENDGTVNATLLTNFFIHK